MSLTLDNCRNKIAIVTGASAGIGIAIAEELVHQGVIVVGLARREDRLKDLAKKLESSKGKFYPFKADMTVEQDILSAFKWIKENLGPVSILINNAGVYKPTTLSEGDTELWKVVFDTNVMGLCIATREAVKDMKASQISGHIIHINSIVGHYCSTAVPNLNVYPASKFAVTALTETLRRELQTFDNNIKITSISPGVVATEMNSVNNTDITPEMRRLYEGVKPLDAKDIADAVVYALSTPPHVQVHEIVIRPLGERC